jgi:hypothetical protein
MNTLVSQPHDHGEQLIPIWFHHGIWNLKIWNLGGKPLSK